MGLSDRLKDLRGKAEDAVVERKDQIQQTVQNVGQAADERTGGKYHEKIQAAGAKAAGFVDGLAEEPDEGAQPVVPVEEPADGESPPAA
jgi:MT0933-like antitoxin protein